MNKIIIIIATLILCIIIIVCAVYTNYDKQLKKIDYFNKTYEVYLNKQVYGSEIATLINKAIDNNEKNNVAKDNNNRYINDNKYSIKIDVYMTDTEKTYNMEVIYNSGINEFIKNFNIIEFKCTKIEYHKDTKRVKYMIFEQVTK